jgi:SPP1 gp7 family putative phage head morphogenesis protein
MGISFGVVPIDAVRASLYSEQSGRNYIVTFKDNARTRIQTTRAAITRMIATGQSWQRTAEELKDQFEKGYNDAVRVVRTETARNYTQGTLNGFERAEDVGINIVKTWLATLDDVTRDTHAALDGTDADEDGLFWIGSDSAEGPGLFADPAEVVNCRCAVIARIGGISPAFRRDNMDKEADPIPYQTWTDWAESKGWSEETGWPKAKDAL